jgi:hypothetical protein
MNKYTDMAAFKGEKRNAMNDANGALSFYWPPRVYQES